jgi:LacI family transcriptional regulator
MAAKKQVTITQVAQEAGVSTQTVSRVINNRPDVAPETRARVLQVIERFNYQPNILARSLIRRHSNTIGVVAMASSYYGPSTTLVGIEKMIRRLGYSLLLDFMHHPERDDVELVINRLVSQQVDGIIWAIPEIANNRAWLNSRRAHLPIPIIYLSMQPQDDLPVAAIDNRFGGCLATDHLLSQGYRQIGIITGPADWWEARQRLAGWREALEDAGQPAADRQVAQGDWSASSGELAVYRLWDQFREMDAVFVSNDQMALGVLKAAHQSGRRVPGDLAVVGFDNIPESLYFWPALTTVDQPLIDLGGRAVERLIQMIKAEQAEYLKGVEYLESTKYPKGVEYPVRDDHQSSETVSLLLKPELVVRDSSTAGSHRK